MLAELKNRVAEKMTAVGELGTFLGKDLYAVVAEDYKKRGEYLPALPTCFFNPGWIGV